MSAAVEFADVRRRIQEFGERAIVITVTPGGEPHVVTAVVEIADDRLVLHLGARSRANLGAQPRLTLTWGPKGGDYQLILDGVADHIGPPDERGVGPISVAIDRGILHRLAEIPGQGPSCLALGS